MVIGSRQKLSKILNEPEIPVGETTIKQVSSFKTLDVVIDKHLTCERQIENIQTKISKGIGMLRRKKNLVLKTTLTKVYNAIILLYFDYCNLVWDNCSDYSLDELQKLHNRAPHVISGKTYETRSLDVLTELHWQPLKKRFKQRKLIFTHTIRDNKMPISTTNMFHIQINLRYNLRSNSLDFSLDKHRTNFMK